MDSRWIVGIVLLGFLGFTAEAVIEHGYLGFFELVIANTATQLVFVDLVIALSLILVWMWRDAAERGESAASLVPYALVTLFFGSAGPLAYLLRRKLPATRPQAQPERA